MPGRMEFDLDLGNAGRQRRAGGAGRLPMRLLVIGDFSAGAVADRPPLADRPTHRVDLDNLDALLARLAPRLTLDGGELRFARIDDFHPDALVERYALFDALRRARAQPAASGGDLLGALLGRPGGAAPSTPAPAPAAGIDALVHRIVAPHVVADTSAQTAAHRTAVDLAMAEQMRKLLHDPRMQALEAVWRGVDWLVHRLELDEKLELHLFDATRDEWLADLVVSGGKPAQTALAAAVADRWRGVPGAEGWSAIAALAGFGTSDAAIGLLAALGLVASRAGAPLIAAADPALVDAVLAADGEGAALAGWQALRRSQAAPWLGLAAPRMLLRQPYGRKSDPVAAFAFEEFAGTPADEQFLWGNPALAVLLLIGRAHSARCNGDEPDGANGIDDLPAVTVERDGDRLLQPCAERLLSDEQAQALLDAGLMPLVGHRQRNAVVLPRLQSVSEPAAPLAVGTGAH